MKKFIIELIIQVATGLALAFFMGFALHLLLADFGVKDNIRVVLHLLALFVILIAYLKWSGK
jgi:hypothetical protein